MAGWYLSTSSALGGRSCEVRKGDRGEYAVGMEEGERSEQIRLRISGWRRKKGAFGRLGLGGYSYVGGIRKGVYIGIGEEGLGAERVW